jgi:ribosomal protein L29
MKKKSFQEIKNKSAAELQKDLAGQRERLRVLKFDLAAGKVKNIREIRVVKKSIAQILTIICQENYKV